MHWIKSNCRYWLSTVKLKKDLYETKIFPRYSIGNYWIYTLSETDFRIEIYSKIDTNIISAFMTFIKCYFKYFL